MPSSTYSPSQTTSYTRLSSFPKCPLKYKLAYVDRVKENTIEVLEDSLLIGRLVHELIEQFLKGAERESAFEIVLPKWLERDCKLSLANEEDDELQAIGISVRSLIDYAVATGELYHRCSANYLEEDAIRNSDGSVPKDPINYPPGQVKKELNAAGLYKTALGTNNIATQLNPQFRRLNLCQMVSKAAWYFYNFQVPEWVAETKGIERRFDDLNMPWKRGKHWLGGIDWDFVTTEGATVICDHKTEKEKPTGLDVMMHPQLNLYANLFYEHTGKLPDYIAIYHLPSGELVMAQVDVNIIAHTIKGLETIEDEIESCEESNRWRKPLSPAEYGSPCFRRDWQTKGLASVCKFFKHCWPDYAFNIEDELKVFEGYE